MMFVAMSLPQKGYKQEIFSVGRDISASFLPKLQKRLAHATVNKRT